MIGLKPSQRAFFAFVLALLMSLTGLTVQAQTGGTLDCIIASNDGRNGFRTDEVTRCRIDTATGNAAFSFKGERRTRTYVSVEPLTTRHLEAATYWLNRVGQLRFPANTNPAGLDPRGFLQAASQATHGFVLTRNKRNGGQAVNVVFVTDGIYRSIDFSGTNLREMPSGLLTTAQ
ncbi:hypothetical protein [Octadecabacter sp. R77987]|uniref:hypothetical protein n=1 Tax=Octadecabacter sp. R77987 TaxID=3093874 RepID=UPI0036719A3A